MNRTLGMIAAAVYVAVVVLANILSSRYGLVTKETRGDVLVERIERSPVPAVFCGPNVEPMLFEAAS